MMPTVNDEALELAAYHEAGHAVAQAFFGYVLRGAQISEDGSGVAHGSGRPVSVVDLRQVLAFASMLLAGVAAEGCVLGYDGESLLACSGAYDNTHVEAVFAEYLAMQRMIEAALLRAPQDMRDPKGYARVPTESELWAAAWHVTYKCVSRHWDCIERIAVALLQKRELSGYEVAVLIGRDISAGVDCAHRTAEALSRVLLTPWQVPA